MKAFTNIFVIVCFVLLPVALSAETGAQSASNSGKAYKQGSNKGALTIDRQDMGGTAPQKAIGAAGHKGKSKGAYKKQNGSKHTKKHKKSGRSKYKSTKRR